MTIVEQLAHQGHARPIRQELDVGDVAGAVRYAPQFVARAVEEGETAVPTPTPPLVPTITLPGNGPAAAPATGGEETAVAPVETSPPFVLPTPIIDCNVLLSFSQPRNGGVANGTVIFNGTANLNNFGSYRIEANGPQTGGQWASLLGRDIDQPVVDGYLGEVNLTQWENSPYLIRLTGSSSDQSVIQQCVIQITLEN
jgi:hypothetical protein